jgi:hypothetical protein
MQFILLSFKTQRKYYLHNEDVSPKSGENSTVLQWIYTALTDKMKQKIKLSASLILR